MLKIRLSMGGAKKRPVYKIVVADSRFPRDGRFIEKLGSFNPLLPKEKKERIKLESERVKHWLSKGAKPTVRVTRILGEVNIMPMPKPGNNPQKAIPKKDRKKDGKEEPKKEAPKQEAKKEEPKKEAPKQEAKKEEPKKEAPKKEEPKKLNKKLRKKNQRKKLLSKKLRKKNQRNNNVESTSIYFVSRYISWPFK